MFVLKEFEFDAAHYYQNIMVNAKDCMGILIN